jgi:hypothetical protein
MIDEELRQQNPLYALGCAIGASFKEVRERMDVLEHENAELKVRLENFGDRGTWKEGETYYELNMVTDHGGFWMALCTTTNRPGTDPVSWRLVAKKPRDR